MSLSAWDVDKYKEEHESEEQWELRRAFLEKWKDHFPEEKLLCLARVFTNIEFLGCRYPTEVMQQVAKLSEDVANSYRQRKKTKIQRTFVSASDAAEDRAKGVKRKGGVVESTKPAKIAFVAQGTQPQMVNVNDSEDEDESHGDVSEEVVNNKDTKGNSNSIYDKSYNDNTSNSFLKEMEELKCIDVRYFRPSMFKTPYGRLVLFIRPWTSKLGNINAALNICGIPRRDVFENGLYSVYLKDVLAVQFNCSSKADGKPLVENLLWNKLIQDCISVVVKEFLIPEGGTITTSDMTSRREAAASDEFGKPVETNVAMKMMKLMGWKGGGLGSEQQGISEPIKPNLRLVERQGLGSTTLNLRQLRGAVSNLMRRFVASDCIDVDLVFSAEFSKEERKDLHNLSMKFGLKSQSYGKDEDRFLVIKKKIDPFSLVHVIIEKGGNTPKYKVFIPDSIKNR